MQVCANCGHTNRPGVLFCENCGTSLTGKAAVGSTKSFEEQGAPGSEQVTSAGTDYFLPGSILRIEIEGGPEPILIKPKQELIFGRRDPATGAMPDIDLTPYAGYRMGVSRRHAAIRTADDSHLDVWDLGSSNGSFLNGQRLNAHRPYRVRDGDRLRLGQMIIRILFQPPDSRGSTVAAVEEMPKVDTGPLVPGESAPTTKVPSEAEVDTEPKKPLEEAPLTDIPLAEAASENKEETAIEPAFVPPPAVASETEPKASDGAGVVVEKPAAESSEGAVAAAETEQDVTKAPAAPPDDEGKPTG